jgi:peptidoglycan/LPS O-acetylase OafA/YrhL
MTTPTTLERVAVTDSAVRDRRRFPLDAVRGVAAVLVILFHANQNQRQGAWVAGFDGRVAEALALVSEFAVGLFFVLSGFVLFLPWVREGLSGRSGRSGREMLLRRFARLLPLYFMVVLVVWGVTNTRLPGNWQDLLLHLSMTHVYSVDYIFWTDGPAWSLAVEFHFYVLMALTVPLLCRWCARLESRRARVAVMGLLPTLMVATGTGWLCWAVAHRAVNSWPTWFGPMAKAPLFAFGMLLAIAVALGAELRHPVARRLLTLAGLAGLGAAVVLRPDHELHASAQLWNLALGLIGTAFVAAIVMSPDRPARWLTWAPMTTLGVLSYGIYLLHEPMMRMLRSHELLPVRDGGRWDWVLTTVIVVAVTVVVATLSSRYVEANGLRILDSIGAGGRPRNYYAHDIAPVVTRPVPAHEPQVVRLPAERY